MFCNLRYTETGNNYTRQIMKTCGCCKNELPNEHFYRAKSQPDGLDRLCKLCRKQASEKSRQKDPERVARVKKQWRSENKDKERAYARRYIEENKEKRAKIMREWRAKNVDKVREDARKWREQNHEKYKASVRKSGKKWRERNGEAKRVEASNRRASKRDAGGRYTFEDVKRIMHQQNNRCACCRAKLVAYHVDHIIPLKLRGSNNPENIQLLCPSCNLSKGAKHPVDFMQSRGFLL